MRRSTGPAILAVALTCIASAAVAQDAGSCVDEVQRLDQGLPVIHEPASETDIAREPGARKGASLGEDQRRQVTALIEQARTAGADGDGERCMQSLTQARALLREAGFGSGQPGSASNTPSGTGLLGTGVPGAAAGAGLPAPPSGAGAGMAGATDGTGAAAAGAAPGGRSGRTATGAGAPGGGAAGGGAGGGGAAGGGAGGGGAGGGGGN
jgi:hypothetical protein